MEANMEAYIRALENVDLGKLDKIASTLAHVVEEGGRIFVAGNGGSHAIAQHLASDLMKPVGSEDLCCDARSLGDNVALITALSNDVSYHNIFSTQLEQYVAERNSPDAVVAFSVSGRSPNILHLQHMAVHRKKISFCYVRGLALDERRDVLGATMEWTRMYVPTELHEDSPLHYYVCESVFSTIAHEIARLFHIKRGNYGT